MFCTSFSLQTTVRLLHFSLSVENKGQCFVFSFCFDAKKWSYAILFSIIDKLFSSMKRNSFHFDSFPFHKPNRRLADERNSETKSMEGVSKIESTTEKETKMDSTEDSSFCCW